MRAAHPRAEHRQLLHPAPARRLLSASRGFRGSERRRPRATRRHWRSASREGLGSLGGSSTQLHQGWPHLLEGGVGLRGAAEEPGVDQPPGDATGDRIEGAALVLLQRQPHLIRVRLVPGDRRHLRSLACPGCSLPRRAATPRLRSCRAASIPDLRLPGRPALSGTNAERSASWVTVAATGHQPLAHGDALGARLGGCSRARRAARTRPEARRAARTGPAASACAYQGESTT